ncbi:uncharacterized protein YbjT (DUF2867 family) [Psychromicrobium silvestre]|uniref:Uncharacterized protein YbjT (DUF2867 family) n=1 Tax=Psychromicrobium silvestre TaxID=1645614 RepID=A0A7Y9LSW8_9MICC|nr:NAD(P)H-binding protein [Psychromicrobium silvestre]NYE95005.1 uncharacterized protein YbjT (DUF2867 family) [Psychromicrobium silvestre]
MKIVIIGGTGRLGSLLQQRFSGHEVIAAAPSTGVNAVTGEGLDSALAGANLVIDVSNSPAFDAEAVMTYFTTATRNLIAAAKVAGAAHFVIVSIVGADELPDSGYLRAKIAQEQLVESAGLSYSIVKATQFAEFADTIIDSVTQDGTIRVPDANLELLAAADLADYVAAVALSEPLNGASEIGGPEVRSFAEVAREIRGEGATITVDSEATYFGTALAENSLVSREGAQHGTTTLAQVRAAQN